MNKKILNKIAEVNKANQKLFEKKAKLEKEILVVDIEIYQLMNDYGELVKKLIN